MGKSLDPCEKGILKSWSNSCERFKRVHGFVSRPGDPAGTVSGCCLHAVFADHRNQVIGEREVIQCLLATNPRRKRKLPKPRHLAREEEKKNILKVHVQCSGPWLRCGSSCGGAGPALVGWLGLRGGERSKQKDPPKWTHFFSHLPSSFFW